jgi:16S rRNA (cytosine1402-N4)-methyltransferase
MCSPPIGTVEDFSSALFHAGHAGVSPRLTSLVGGLQMSQDFTHNPVLRDEIVEIFSSVPSGTIVDATLGGAGHSRALLESRLDLAVIGLDRDPMALEVASERLASFGPRAIVRHGRFAEMADVVAEVVAKQSPPPPIVGVLFDLGVSSPQLDQPERGFSYRFDGPLDMRMDPTVGTDAMSLVNEASQGELAALFAANGEGRLAGRIARAVVAARPITSTQQLAEVVAGAVPAAVRRRGHPAKRVFQAVRIAVNDELGQLEAALPVALELLSPGGRCAVISYHSGEDRMVKYAFNEAVTGGCVCPPGLPCVCGADPKHRLVFRGSHGASAAEMARNRRAESARLRVIERMADSGSVPS